MRRIPLCLTFLTMTVFASRAAVAQQPGLGPGPRMRPCAEIRAVCQQAGFIQAGAKAGEGLVLDCIRPIMAGGAQRPRSAKPLPPVDPQLVEACRAQNANFGIGNAALQNPNEPPAQGPPPLGPTQG